MRLDAESLRRIAAATRIALSPEEEARYAADLRAVLAWAGSLGAVEVAGTEPLLRPSAEPDADRPDRPERGLEPRDALAPAPDTRDGFFRVPRVLESGR